MSDKLRIEDNQSPISRIKTSQPKTTIIMNYTEEQLDAIWAKTKKSKNEENERRGYRKDMCGAWIKRDQYGKKGKYGWEVDHIYPKSFAEENLINDELYNDITNLQPLHHRNQGPAGKGEEYPSFRAVVSSDEYNNIFEPKRHTIPHNTQIEIETLFKGYIKMSV